jgi:transcriptional regulator NrdR family protein
VSVAVCEACGGTRFGTPEARVERGARRRRLVCKGCGTAFSTLEVRLNEGMESAVLLAKLNEWIEKEKEA